MTNPVGADPVDVEVEDVEVVEVVVVVDDVVVEVVVVVVEVVLEFKMELGTHSTYPTRVCALITVRMSELDLR